MPRTHTTRLNFALVAAAALAGAALPMTGGAQTPGPAPAPVAAASAAGPTYADLAALGDGAPLVIRAVVKRQTSIPAERAPGLRAGYVRLLIDAETSALLAGTAPVGGTLRYLVDVPLTAKGKAPKLKKQAVLLFAAPVPGRPGELTLVDSRAQLPATPAVEARVRAVMAQYAAADAPPRITGVRDALAVPGTLTGESETQIFLDTATGDPASITVTRRPGQAPYWGVSWGDIVDQAAAAPGAETLAWYRLACALPERLPAGANLASDPAARTLAAGDYAFVRAQLGGCATTR